MTVTLDHKFAIKTDTERQCLEMVEDAAHILAAELDVEITLRMERMGGWGGSDARHRGSYCRQTKLVKINYKNLTGQPFERVLRVLCHEFRHAVQYQHDICDDIPDTDFSDMSWGSDTRYVKYLNRRAEKDARHYEKPYASMVRNHPTWESEYTMTDFVEGDRALTIDDYTATCVGLGVNPSDIQLFKTRDGNQFWFHIDDIPRSRKFTKATCKKVWANHRDQLESQPWIPVQRELTMLDLTS